VLSCGSDNLFKKVQNTTNFDGSMISGNADAALPASLSRSLARAFSLPFPHSLSLFGCFGGVLEDPPPPVSAVMTAVMVIPCSLKTSLIFSLSVCLKLSQLFDVSEKTERPALWCFERESLVLLSALLEGLLYGF